MARPKLPPGPVYLRTSEVAELLHVSRETVTRWAKAGKLPVLKTLGGHHQFPEAEIRALVAELTVRVGREMAQ